MKARERGMEKVKREMEGKRSVREKGGKGRKKIKKYLKILNDLKLGL